MSDIKTRKQCSAGIPRQAWASWTHRSGRSFLWRADQSPGFRHAWQLHVYAETGRDQGDRAWLRCGWWRRRGRCDGRGYCWRSFRRKFGCLHRNRDQSWCTSNWRSRDGRTGWFWRKRQPRCRWSRLDDPDRWGTADGPRRRRWTVCLWYGNSSRDERELLP
jgi:hypothetical protein